MNKNYKGMTPNILCIPNKSAVSWANMLTVITITFHYSQLAVDKHIRLMWARKFES